MLERLTSLARAVALDPELEVRPGGRGGGWRYHAGERRIEVDPDDLEALDPDALRGLICHEAAHGALTRYPFLVPAALLEDLRVQVVLNALEDCRIETWLLDRLPGTRPWLERCNDRLFPASGLGLAGQPPVLQYALGLIHRWWHGELPETLEPAVVAALRETSVAIRQIIAIQPAGQPYSGSRAQAVFRRLEGERRVGRAEGAVRVAAEQAWALTWTAILPVVSTLPALPAENDALQRFLEQTQVHLDRPPLRPDPLEPVDLPRLQRAQRPVLEGWEALRAELLPSIRTLTDELERLLEPDRAPRWRGGQRSGQRVELKAAMRRQARPDTLEIWSRKSLPHKRDARFLLLVDLSGSMRGERIHGALRGVVLLAEVLERLGIRFAIEGFQDRAVVFKRFDEALVHARSRLLEFPLEVAGVRPGGNNQPEHNHDGPALRAAAGRLLGDGGRTPVLIVVSDGEPSGPEDAAASLRSAVEALGSEVHLVGLGLGPGTGHVASFYPHHAVDLPVDELPAALASVLEGALR